jgi:hypothetical protein
MTGQWYQCHRPTLVSGINATAQHWSVVSMPPPDTGQWYQCHRPTLVSGINATARHWSVVSTTPPSPGHRHSVDLNKKKNKVPDPTLKLYFFYPKLLKIFIVTMLMLKITPVFFFSRRLFIK